MCELFGVNGKQLVSVNEYLKEFVSHSKDHPNGWGLALFYGDSVNVEKEPVKALNSRYLRERLRHPLEARNMLGHIRLATRGGMDYENCHPFVKRDDSGRAWTLIHNGTIFNCDILDKYFHEQEGRTDSERILYYIVDKINQKRIELQRELTDSERFDVLDRVVQIIAPNNKVNLLIYDGELMYVHSNFRGSLHCKRHGDSVIFSTVPLDRDEWNLVAFTQLEAYKEGHKVFEGTKHDAEYIFKPEDMHFIYLDSSNL